MVLFFAVQQMAGNDKSRSGAQTQHRLLDLLRPWKVQARKQDQGSHPADHSAGSKRPESVGLPGNEQRQSVQAKHRRRKKKPLKPDYGIMVRSDIREERNDKEGRQDYSCDQCYNRA
jgi:hypothetical protein